MCVPPWFGQTGRRTAVIFRATVFFVPTIVVRLRTMRTTWISPQRSTCTAGPMACFHCVMTFFFGVDRGSDGRQQRARAATTIGVMCLFIDRPPVSHSAKRSLWTCRRGTPALRTFFSMTFTIPGGPLMNTSRSAMSGTSSSRCSGDSR